MIRKQLVYIWKHKKEGYSNNVMFIVQVKRAIKIFEKKFLGYLYLIMHLATRNLPTMLLMLVI